MSKMINLIIYLKDFLFGRLTFYQSYIGFRDAEIFRQGLYDRLVCLALDRLFSYPDDKIRIAYLLYPLLAGVGFDLDRDLHSRRARPWRGNTALTVFPRHANFTSILSLKKSEGLKLGWWMILPKLNCIPRTSSIKVYIYQQAEPVR